MPFLDYYFLPLLCRSLFALPPPFSEHTESAKLLYLPIGATGVKYEILPNLKKDLKDS